MHNIVKYTNKVSLHTLAKMPQRPQVGKGRAWLSTVKAQSIGRADQR